MCFCCERGGLVSVKISSSPIKVPEKTIEDTISSLVKIGVIGRVIFSVFLNGKKISDGDFEKKLPWNASLFIISTAR